MEILQCMQMFFYFFIFFDWVGSEHILRVNSTLERHRVIQDFVLERLEQLQMRPMRNSPRNCVLVPIEQSSCERALC